MTSLLTSQRIFNMNNIAENINSLSILYKNENKLWNHEVCDNRNAMKQCNFQNNYGAIAQRKVCSCAPIFNFFNGPPKLSLRSKFIPKITIFGDLVGCRPKPTFFKSQR